MRISKNFLILSLIALTGCQGLWTRIDATSVAYKGDHYAVDLPTDWVRLQQNKIMLTTRDGIGVQSITFGFREHDKAFEETKQKSTPDMLPSDLADRYIAELRAADEHGLPSLEVISNRPAMIDGRLGFELHLQFLNDDGLRYERLVSGFTNETGFFVISYQAPSLHFFERDRATYQQVLQTFKAI
jgi:hypothetical protein